MGITHPFVSQVADGADANKVRPSNWNASHVVPGIKWATEQSGIDLTGVSSSVAALQAAADAAVGRKLFLPAGIYLLDAPVTLDNVHVVCGHGVFIKVSGSAEATFGPGAIQLTNGAIWEGGEIYTAGTMGGTTGHVFKVVKGTLRGATIYSQLYSAITGNEGVVEDCTLYGAHNRTLEMRPGSALHKVTLRRNRIHNTGVRYVDKVWTTVNTTNIFAMIVVATVDGVGRVEVLRNTITHSGKQGIWIQPTDQNTMVLPEVRILGNVVENVGYYLDAAGAEQLGDGAGTSIEVIACEDAVIRDNVCRRARGYLCAVATNSHRTIVQDNTLIAAEDPAIVLFAAHDCIVKSNYIADATVGVSVGEDGATANNGLVVGNTIERCSQGALRFTAGTELRIYRNEFIDCSESTAYVGSFSGYGQLYDVMRIHTAADRVHSRGNLFRGKYTEIYRTVENDESKLVAASEDVYECPYMPPVRSADVFRQQGAPAVWAQRRRVWPIFADDVGDRLHSGVIYLDTATQFSHSPVDLSLLALTDYTPFLGASSGSPSPNADQYWLLYAVKKTANMTSPGRLLVGLTASFDGGHAFVHAYMNSVLSNATTHINGFQDDEWIPIAVPLASAMHSTVQADYSNVTRFIINKQGPAEGGTAYDMYMTKPVIVGGFLPDPKAIAADTSGATLGALETEVNNLKALLRELTGSA